MKLFWNSRKEEIRMAESQKNQTEKENIVDFHEQSVNGTL